MRKLGLLILSCIAVVALTAFSAPAFGAFKVDAGCDLLQPAEGDGVAGPYDNDVEVHDFTIAYTSKVEHTVAGYTASGLACGTRIGSGISGVGTLFNNAKIRQAPGEVTNSTDAMPAKSYVGNGSITAASFVAGEPAIIKGQHFTLRTDPTSECQRENDSLVGGGEPGPIVACYKGTATGMFPVHNWNWVVEQGKRDVTVIGQSYNDFGTKPPWGLVSLQEFQLCAYTGATGEHGTAGTCGEDLQPPDLSKPLRRNGEGGGTPKDITKVKAGEGGCAAGLGLITATAIRRDGVTTPPASTCAPWLPTQYYAMPHS